MIIWNRNKKSREQFIDEDEKRHKQQQQNWSLRCEKITHVNVKTLNISNKYWPITNKDRRTEMWTIPVWGSVNAGEVDESDGAGNISSKEKKKKTRETSPIRFMAFDRGTYSQNKYHGDIRHRVFILFQFVLVAFLRFFYIFYSALLCPFVSACLASVCVWCRFVVVDISSPSSVRVCFVLWCRCPVTTTL